MLMTFSREEGEVVCCSNRSSEGDGVRVLNPGTYGLSNQQLDSPWLKVQQGKLTMEQVLRQPMVNPAELTDSLFKLLADDTWYGASRNNSILTNILQLAPRPQHS